MRAAMILAALGIALAISGWSMMRCAGVRADGNLLLGAAIALVGVALILIAAVRVAL